LWVRGCGHRALACSTMRVAIVLLAAVVAGDRTITQVVKLLEGMLDKSKADGKSDRELFAKFQCYCDHTSEEKTTAIASHVASIEGLTATIADRTAQSAQLEAEIAELQAAMNDNEKARLAATSARAKEHAHYEAESADMQTGTSQLNRALDMLKAVDPLGAESFLQTRATRWSKASAALRSAAAYLPPPQKKHVLAAAKAQNAPTGGIAGVLKTFSDTFVQNLETATAAENAAQHDHDVLDAAQLADYETMEAAKQAKEVTLGEHQAEIATATTEKETTETTLAEDEAFLAALKVRCKEKKAEYDHRNELRMNEEVAIAQAVAILNSDAAFGTFGKVSATSTGGTLASFVQLSSPTTAAAETLARVARKHPSLRLASVAADLAAGTDVFDKVLGMLNKTIARIDKEEAADQTQLAWCEKEQTSATDGQTAKETNLGTLAQTISTLQTGINGTIDSQADATESLATNRESQKTETEQRNAEHAAYQEDLANLQDAEKILVKAIEVLEKYYDWLEAQNAPHHYEKHSGKDTMGGNLKRMADASQSELEEACSVLPECKGFTSLGWLKSELPGSEDYFGAASDLYVKVFDRTAGHAALLQRGHAKDEPATWGDGVESEGQRGKGAEVLEMLRYILSETTAEKNQATTDENNAQTSYTGLMTQLKGEETSLLDSLSTLATTLASQRKSLEEAEEDTRETQKDLDMIVQYLADIEPGCTFIQDNYETRRQNREDEKTALNEAIAQLQSTPAFTATTTAAP
jgi:hypothetical protein